MLYLLLCLLRRMSMFSCEREGGALRVNRPFSLRTSFCEPRRATKRPSLKGEVRVVGFSFGPSRPVAQWRPPPAVLEVRWGLRTFAAWRALPKSKAASATFTTTTTSKFTPAEVRA